MVATKKTTKTAKTSKSQSATSATPESNGQASLYPNLSRIVQICATEQARKLLPESEWVFSADSASLERIASKIPSEDQHTIAVGGTEAKELVKKYKASNLDKFLDKITNEKNTDFFSEQKGKNKMPKATKAKTEPKGKSKAEKSTKKTPAPKKEKTEKSTTPEGLTPNMVKVLEALLKAPQGLTAKGITEATGIEKGRRLPELEDLGYISREIQEGERGMFSKITTAGKQALKSK